MHFLQRYCAELALDLTALVHQLLGENQQEATKRVVLMADKCVKATGGSAEGAWIFKG